MTEASSKGYAYTVSEAARRMRLDPIDVADLIFDGELKCESHRRLTFIAATEVTRFVEEQRAVESLLMKLIEIAVRKGVMEKASLAKKGYATFRFRQSSTLRGYIKSHNARPAAAARKDPPLPPNIKVFPPIAATSSVESSIPPSSQRRRPEKGKAKR